MEVMPETSSVDPNMARSSCFHELSYGLSRQLSREGLAGNLCPNCSVTDISKCSREPLYTHF